MIRRTRGCLRATAVLGLFALASLLGVVTLVSPLEAGMENARFALHYKPKFVASKAIPNLCDNPATTSEEPNYSPNYTDLPCHSYTVSAPLGAGQVYVVIGRAGSDGVAAASFGVTYNGSTGMGIDPAHVTWTPCADGLSFPSSDGVHGNFPQPGGGLRITWNNTTSCQTEIFPTGGVHAVVGAFYVYAYSNDALRLTPNNNIPGGPEAAVSNCAGVTTDLIDIWGLRCIPVIMGRIDFGIGSGYNPCFIDQYPCLTTPVTPSTWGTLKAKYKEGH